MNTQELKQYIDRVLGNNIRCLLPSYWWKKLFGEVVDNIDTIKGSVNKLNSKIQDIELYERIKHADLLDKVLNRKLIPGKQYAIIDYECTVNRFIDGVSSTYNNKQEYTIIVTANSTHELNENVELAMGNGWYSDTKTESTFEAKYTVFNDASMFNWAKKEDPYIYYFIILDNPPLSHLAKQAVSWSEKERKLITNYCPESTDTYTGILVDSQGNPVDLDTHFSYGDTAYVKIHNEIYSGKIVYTSRMRESGDAVLVTTDTSGYWSNEFMCFVWNEDSQTYTDTEGYPLLDTNQNIINTKQSVFLLEGRYIESHYKHLCYPMGFGVPGGKGVIYYLKDQNGNEAPYDFKNILFYIPEAGYALVFTFNVNGNDQKDGSRQGDKYVNVKIEDNNGNINKVAFSGYTNNVKVSSSVYNKYFTEDISNKKIGIDSKHNLVIFNEFDDSTIDIDTEISDSSENVVQNKVIKAYVDEKVENLSNEIITNGEVHAGVEIRELRTNSNLSDEDKAYNIETVQKYKEGKALVVVEVVSRIITSAGIANRMLSPFFVDLYESEDSTKLANFQFVSYNMNIDGVNNVSVPNGLVTVDITIYTDGSAYANGGWFYDNTMSDTSENAVQNKVVTAAINDLNTRLAALEAAIANL